MKKNFFLLFLFCTSLNVLTAQVRQSGSVKSVQKVSNATGATSMQASRNVMRIVPIPAPIKHIQYINVIHPTVQSGNVMDKKSNLGNAGGSHARTSMSSSNAAVQIMSEPVANKTYGDGHKASYRLVSNTSGWSNNPSYSRRVINSQPLNEGEGWKCASVTQSFSAQSNSFMNAAANQKGSSLVPGTIYTFNDYAQGNFKELADGRNPVVVYTTTTAGNNNANVQTPNAQTLSQGISSIVGKFTAAQGAGGASEQVIYSDNQSDLNMLVSAGGAYSAYSGFGVTKQGSSSHHIYVTYDAIKPLYTMMVQRPANGYFANGQVPSSSSPLVVVQNVTYGTRVLANIDITTTSKTNYDSLHLQWTSGANNAKIDFSALAADKSVSYTGNIMIVGTTTNIPIISMQNFEQQISDLFAKGDYKSAAPIQYQLTDLDGNVLGVESVTDQFTYQECSPANDVFTLTSALATLQTGDDGKNSESEFWLELYKGTAASNIKIGTFYDNHTSIDKNFNPTVNIALNNPNYSLDDFNTGGAILLRLKSHAHTGGDDWDIAGLTLTLTFNTKGGISQVKTIHLSRFRFSDASNPVFYFNAGFQLIGN